MEGGQRIMRLMPGGERHEDRLATDMARLDELERQLVRETADLETAIWQAERAISELPEQQQIIMRLRYVKGLSWREVAKESYYSESHCKYIHAIAIRNIGIRVETIERTEYNKLAIRTK
jgi:DNA-directed RNA polymerase specialized sigma subunit